YGFRDALWTDTPTEAMLDAASDGAPVVLISGDLHCAWANSAARELYGLTDEPAGLLREEPAFQLNMRLSALSDEQLDRGAAEAARAAAERGVVGIVELEMATNIDVWRRRIDAGLDSLRVRCGIYPAHLDDALARGFRTGEIIEGTRGLATVGPVKVITDGSLNTRTAYCHAEYPGTGGHGMSTVTFDELVALMTRLLPTGLVPTVHAIGDAANTLVLDAYAATGSTGSIEHAQLVAASDFARFAELGVTASVQPEHAMDDRDVADVIWQGRTDRAFAFESLLSVGARIVLGSDAPVAPLDPWISMAAAVSRSRDGRDPWHPEQRVSALAAWRASTGRTGLAVGDPADVVVTDLDPLVATDEQLRSFPVAATIVAGRRIVDAL
ncbi:MAG: amidohydrolase family protein, partial [Microbacteriaceae bacterium]